MIDAAAGDSIATAVMRLLNVGWPSFRLLTIHHFESAISLLLNRAQRRDKSQARYGDRSAADRRDLIASQVPATHPRAARRDVA